MSDENFLQGDDLNAYRVTPSGLCWWCGSVADSQEHKFKRKNLARLSEGSKEDLIWVSGETRQPIRSIRKSRRVRFRPNLCAACNNARSQPFDLAYDRFVDYLWSDGRRLRYSRYIDMKRVYGDSWAADTVNLARYFVKQIGCRVEDDGFPVPPEFARFLDGGSLVPSLHMVTYKDLELWRLHRGSGKKKDWIIGEGFGAMTGAVSPSLGRLTMFSSSMVVGYIGIAYRWELREAGADPFYKYRRARLHRRDRLPDI
ncbi:hypothetical protein ACFQ7B_34210 [Streptomyces erythrochromogenes]|uniref:hypothetical protein n=1 Tax=Streptomyces erythrochromogenes TaxID=285574 RepID=UPI0036803B48